jgi:VWFA-related protein
MIEPSRRSRARGARAALFAGLVASLANASLGGAQEPPATFGERVDVEVVDVDVVVLERGGRRVLDLRREEFELLVDGRPVAIDYFRPPATAVEVLRTAEPDAGAPETDPSAPETVPSYLVVYVDHSSLRPDRRGRAVAELREFVRGLRRGERVAVAAFATGRLHLVAPPSEDAAAIEAAFDALAALPVDVSAAAEQRHLDVRIRNLRAPTGRDSESVRRMIEQEALSLDQEIRVWFDQEVARQLAAIASLRHLVDSLAAIDGRKSVVVASSGITVEAAEGLRELLREQLRSLGIFQEDLERKPLDLGPRQRVDQAFEGMVAAAQNARVALYAVYPHDDSMLRNSAEFASVGTSGRAMSRDPSSADRAASLARMTGATGGRSFLLARNLDEKLVAVREDAESVYSLGFTTGAAAGTGEHKIEVRVARPKLEVRHREGFRRPSAGELAEQALFAAATLGETGDPLGLRVELGAGRAVGSGGDRLVPIAVRVPLGALALLPEGDERRGRLALRIALQDERGAIFLSDPVEVPIAVAEAEIERALGSDWVHRAEVRLTPSTSRIAVLVVDELAGTHATAAAAVPPAARAVERTSR